MQCVNRISLVTAHFGNLDWICRLLRALRRHTPIERVSEIVIINQNRTSRTAEQLRSLDPLVRIVTYPRSEPHFNIQGHDHAAVLNRVMGEVRGEWLALFDVDCLPIVSDWLTRAETALYGYDALLAGEPRRGGLSHPCFMLVPANVAPRLQFDDGLLEKKIDTGRRIYSQLLALGYRPRLLPPRLAHNGWWGNVYLGCIYHHSHGTFRFGETRLSRQCNWLLSYFDARIERRGIKPLTVGEWLTVFFHVVWRAPRSTLVTVVRSFLQSLGLDPYSK